MQRLSHPTDTVLSNEINRNRIVLSFQDSPRKPLRRRPMKDNLDDEVWEEGDHRVHASSSPTTRKQKQQEKQQRLKSSVAGTTGKLKCFDRQGRSKSAQVC